MKNKIPPLIAFFVLLIAVASWVFYSIKKPITNYQEVVVDEDKSIIAQSKNQEWMDAMAQEQGKNYRYPTNEMILKYDFNRGIEPLRVFVRDLSEYRFYCINQILIENKIEYAYYKTHSVIQLVIFLNDQKMQKKILEDFDYYKVAYSLYNPKS